MGVRGSRFGRGVRGVASVYGLWASHKAVTSQGRASPSQVLQALPTTSAAQPNTPPTRTHQTLPHHQIYRTCTGWQQRRGGHTKAPPLPPTHPPTRAPMQHPTGRTSTSTKPAIEGSNAEARSHSTTSTRCCTCSQKWVGEGGQGKVLCRPSRLLCRPSRLAVKAQPAIRSRCDRLASR